MGGYGTLTEVAHAIKLGRPVVSLASWEIRPPDGDRAVEAVHVAETPGDAVDWLMAQLSQRSARSAQHDGPHEITGVVQETRRRRGRVT